MSYELVKPENRSELEITEFESDLLEMQLYDIDESIIKLQHRAMDLYDKEKKDTAEMADLLERVKRMETRRKELKSLFDKAVKKISEERRMDVVAIDEGEKRFGEN